MSVNRKVTVPDGPMRALPTVDHRSPAHPASRPRSRRLLAWSLRSNDETWVSTVRTDTNMRVAISAFDSCSPSPASTSASLRVIPLPAPRSAITVMIAPTARPPIGTR